MNKRILNIFPKVGDSFYWKGINKQIHKDVCLRIEQEDNPDLETMFFTYISPNGGGIFVTESCLINPDSLDAIEYEKNKSKEMIAKISNYISQENVRSILYEKLRNGHFSPEDASHILDILTK